MLIFDDERFDLHHTGAHPEHAARLQAIRQQLGDLRTLPGWVRKSAVGCDMADLQRIHPADYLMQLQQTAERGGGRMDADTVVSANSWEVAQLAAGTCCAAVRSVVSGDTPRAMCLVRPPGHHALPSRAMGFCLLANISIAAKFAREVLQVDRVLIVDWDVHHGNGTQAIFYEDGQVTFFSMHRFPFYPGSGTLEESGTGEGLGKTINVPVRFGSSRRAILELFEQGLQQAVKISRPQLILLSAGFDAHRLDPVGSLGLETEDFAELTRMVVEAANTHCGGRIVSVLEGGYHPQTLSECVELHLQTLAQPH